MDIVWLVVGLLLGFIIMASAILQIEGNRKEYFCPDCKTFRGKNEIHERKVDYFWGFELQRMCLCCGKKSVVEWQDYLKGLAMSGRLGCGCIEPTTEEVECDNL